MGFAWSLGIRATLMRNVILQVIWGGGFGICTFIYLHRHSDFTEIAEETFDKFILLITNI